ncbi:MAG: ATP-binding protein [Caldilineales bacterium]|nr:ATP-binding protein [Caldilineales bacterium]MCW5858529.1 ATP-binding protein [Caldilineales bacterium]
MMKLPIGIQAFEVMRSQGFVYVDKTRWIHQLVTEGIYYFMARPRRFGKSLLVSTLRCLFQGRRELFDGLWIAEPGRWDWQPHPVVVLDFNQIAHDTPENLHLGLMRALEQIAESYQLSLREPLLQGRFVELVLKLQQVAGQPVVVLIDEYDKPLIDHLGRGEPGLEVARANRDILRNFFAVLKGSDVAPVLRFVLLTGVSRFSRVSVFSALNNLNDISMHEDYAGMLGYTDEELDPYFSSHITRLATKLGVEHAGAHAALAHYYDGYRFSTSPLQVYNPFSVLVALDRRELNNYWFETGTPTFLIDLLREKQYSLPALEGLQVSPSAFSTFELERLSPEALLFQTGYLTIHDVQDNIYTLGYPNQEVKTAFTEAMLFGLESLASETSSHVLRLSRYLQAENLTSFFTSIQAVFASIPYDIQTKRDEAYYHTLFYLMLSASGGQAQSSVLTARGRIDMVVAFPDKVYVVEFKCNQDARAAIRQIRGQGYADPYGGGGRKVLLLGIDFSTEARNVAEWVVEEG